jgi:hypothetical protein
MKIKYNDFIQINEKSNVIISMADLEKTIKEIFTDSKVSSVDTTYEKDEDEFRFIITLNNIFYENSNVIYNKLLFYTDSKKRKLEKNYFKYLYDLNCKFKKVSFNDIEDLYNKLNNIFENNKFGKNLKTLSTLNITMTKNVNEWILNNEINNISVYNISYNPIINSMPCESMFFRFDINIGDTRTIGMNIRKTEDVFAITFNEGEWFNDITISDLEALPQAIGEMIKKYII